MSSEVKQTAYRPVCVFFFCFFFFRFIISSLFCGFLFYLRQLASEEHFFNMLDYVHSNNDFLPKYSSICTSVTIFHLGNFLSTRIMYILNWCSTNIFCWVSDHYLTLSKFWTSGQKSRQKIIPSWEISIIKCYLYSN